MEKTRMKWSGMETLELVEEKKILFIFLVRASCVECNMTY